MSWASRITLILGIPWAFLWLVVCGPGSNPYAFVTWEWYWGIFLFGVVPLLVVWIILRLILGDRGAVYRSPPQGGLFPPGWDK